MPWTESRSRDEWLAEVCRRGARIRRRRRLAGSAAAVLAVVVPATAFTVLADRETYHSYQVAVAGETPGTGPSSAGAAAPAADTTTTTLVLADPPVRVAPSPPTSTSVVPARPNDDPVVVRTTVPASTTTSVAPRGGSSGSPLLVPPPPTTAPPPPDPALAACAVADVKVTVTFDRARYAPGETVRWSSTLENRAATTCLVSGRAFFHVEDGAGRTVSSFAYTADFQLPVKAEPGRTFTNALSWDQKDCTASACVPAPAGNYVVVAAWTEAGNYVGRGTFAIGT